MYKVSLHLILVQVIFLFGIDSYAIAQWRAIAIPNVQNVELNSIFFTNANTGFIAGLGIILKTTDGGENWQQVYEDTTQSFDLESVAFADANTGVAVGYSSVSGIEGLIMRSTDGGENWTPQPVSANFALNDIDFVNDTLGFTVGNSGLILKTTNAGETWVPLASGVTMNLNGVSMVDAQTAYATGYSGASNSGVLKTTNGGNSWMLSPPERVIGVSFTSPDTGYVGWTDPAETAIYRTTDGGANWDYRLVDSGSIFQSIFFTATDTGYVAGYHSGGVNGGIFETTDGGDHWARAVQPARRVVDIYFSSATTGYALTQDSLYKKEPFLGIENTTTPPLVNFFQLFPNYTNPFNSSTEIRYSIPISEKVTLTIHNILGQRIRALISQEETAGEHRVIWDGKDDSGQEVSSGIYFYQLQAGEFREVRRAVLLR
jgi:photosystem II stability/assembly factor-like uncharacterized protein